MGCCSHTPSLSASLPKHPFMTAKCFTVSCKFKEDRGDLETVKYCSVHEYQKRAADGGEGMADGSKHPLDLSDLTVINAGVSVGLGTVVAVDPKAKVFITVMQSTHHLLRKMRSNYSSTNDNTPFIAQGFKGFIGNKSEKSICKGPGMLALGLKRV